MSSINILPISIRRKVGLLISDSDVEVISWHKGVFERVAIFSNDELGLSRFVAFLEKNNSEYKNASFRILTNIIGEDYRVEKVAHLIGKYRTDFHNRRMQQLFRGVSLCMSFLQGREERGRREDIVLFYGMLTEGKVLPWMKAVMKNNTIEAVLAMAFVNDALLKKVSNNWRKGPNLLMTLHEKGLLRQTHYDKGYVRFSRVSKISDESTEEMATFLKKELERTLQYLNSLKISIAGGLDIHFICPGNAVGQLRELLKGSEKIRFHFHDASAVAQGMGVQSAMGELGRDSSLSMHIAFSRIWFKQLASFNQIRYYWMRTVSIAASVAFVAYGSIGAFNAAAVLTDSLEYRNINSGLTAQRDEVQSSYDEQFGKLEEPPSNPENIEAVSETFRLLSSIEIDPSSLIYYFGSAYQKNKRVQLNNVRWYMSSNPADQEGSSLALVMGEDIYQVLEVEGEFLPIPNESYIDVASRADILIDSFEERGDVEVQAIELPRRELVKENLGGVLTEDYNVDAARSRNFRIRIIWKKYDKDLIDASLERRA